MLAGPLASAESTHRPLHAAAHHLMPAQGSAGVGSEGLKALEQTSRLGPCTTIIAGPWRGIPTKSFRGVRHI